MTTLIVGGGPAGAAAAITLANGGAKPHLIERNIRTQDVVCGGFLGWDAIALLRRLGVDLSGLRARPVSRLRLIDGERQVEAALPYPAAGLSRRTLDAALLDRAEEAGATVSRGLAVSRASLEDRTIYLKNGDELTGSALIVSTGKHELRGAARPLADRRDELAIGLRAVLPHSLARQRALAGTIELHLFDDGYAGMLLQEDDTINLCLSTSPARLAAAGSPPAVISALAGRLPIFAERIGADSPTEISAVAGVPYGWRAQSSGPGIFRIGDQGAVIASLAGDGIAIALSSGIGAAQALLANGPAGASAWQAQFRQRTFRPLAVAEALRHGAEQDGTRRILMKLLRMFPALAGTAARLTRIGMP